MRGPFLGLEPQTGPLSARLSRGDVLPLCALSYTIAYIGAACGRANYGEPNVYLPKRCRFYGDPFRRHLRAILWRLCNAVPLHGFRSDNVGGGKMSASIQTEHLKAFVEWLETCEYKYTISSMQGGAVHVKFFIDEVTHD